MEHYPLGKHNTMAMSCYHVPMTFILKNNCYLSLIIVLATSFAMADDTIEKVSPNTQGQKLEDSLKRLNSIIPDIPSRHHHTRAGVLFRLGQFQEAIQDYDYGIRFGSPHNTNSCWERGLAQYYAGDFQGGKEQFSRYHRVGALDIENGLWRMLCIAEDKGMEIARQTMLEYPNKRRKPFPALLALYLNKGNTEAVFTEATLGITLEQELRVNLFNAHYYVGKYYEITEQKGLALTHIREALKHKTSHIMYACAEIDVKRLETPK